MSLLVQAPKFGTIKTMSEQSNSGETLGDAVAKAIGKVDNARARQSVEGLRSIMDSNADVLNEAIQSIVNEMRLSGRLSEDFVATLRASISTVMAARIDRARTIVGRAALRFHRESILRAIPVIVARLTDGAAKTVANKSRGNSCHPS